MLPGFLCRYLTRLCVVSSVFLIPVLGSAEEQCVFSSEAFAFKKIIEFWKDGDKEMVQKQIISFLEKYKNTALRDKLYAMLGDIYFEKNNYQDAFAAYDFIQGNEFREKTFGNRLHALFALDQHQRLVSAVRPVLQAGSGLSSQQKSLFAQSLYQLAVQSQETNEKLSLLKEAKPHLLTLVGTIFADSTLLPLAETHRLLQEYPEAAACYIALAEKQPRKKESFLFQAAIAKKQYAPTEAKPLFAELVKIAEEPFILGVSLTAVGEYEKAIPQLSAYVDAKRGSAIEFKMALYDLLLCAQQTNHLKLFEKSLHTWNTLYPHGQEQETLQYQYGLLLSTHQEWAKSRSVFLSFLEKFPRSSLYQAACRNALQCSLKENNKELIAADLLLSLSKDGVLTIEEEQPMRLLLIKTLYELHRFGEALSQCQDLDVSSGDAQFLLALCVQKTASDSRLFITEAEKALTLATPPSHPEHIRLHLFNSYIGLSHPTQDDYRLAAEHLWACKQNPATPINAENQLWLANYFYEQVKAKPDASSSFLPRAIFLYETLVHTDKGTADESALSSMLVKETAALKLAELYTLSHLSEKRIALLEKLAEEQKKTPEIPWKLQKRVLFELALSYELTHQNEKALQIYDLLLRSSKASYVSKAAILHAAKLRFALIEKKDKESPEMQDVLSTLKELQIKKRAESEPLHLEAALAYAEICTHLTDTSHQLEKELFYLKRIKEDFSSESDILMKEYHSAIAQSADKAVLFQNYMRFVDAEIARLEAEMAQEMHNGEEAEKWKDKAAHLLSPLKQNAAALSPYLSERIKKL